MWEVLLRLFDDVVLSPFNSVHLTVYELFKSRLEGMHELGAVAAEIISSMVVAVFISLPVFAVGFG